MIDFTKFKGTKCIINDDFFIDFEFIGKSSCIARLMACEQYYDKINRPFETRETFAACHFFNKVTYYCLGEFDIHFSISEYFQVYLRFHGADYFVNEEIFFSEFVPICEELIKWLGFPEETKKEIEVKSRKANFYRYGDKCFGMPLNRASLGTFARIKRSSQKQNVS